MERPPSQWAADPDPEPELEGLLGGAAGPMEEGTSDSYPPLVRPLSPTRLQSLLPPEARADPEFREVGACSPSPTEPSTSSLYKPELRSALRSASSPRRRPRASVRFHSLVLLLDAALTGELDVVQQAVAELDDPSQPNEEGITALHNAICGANHAIVDFLIACGTDANAPDSHGWWS